MKSLINKLGDAISHRNHIRTTGALHSTAYISGSEISGEVQIDEGCKIYRSHILGKVTIGRYSSLWGPDIHVLSHISNIKVGQFCSVARNVSLQESNHRMDTPTSYNIRRNIFGEIVTADMVSKGPIEIENDVWIGANVTILTGVTIGNGAVIGANAVVTRDIPPYSVVAGNPATVLKYRFNEEIIEMLLKLSWWNWEMEKIIANKHFFESQVNMNSIRNIIK